MTSMVPEKKRTSEGVTEKAEEVEETKEAEEVEIAEEETKEE